MLKGRIQMGTAIASQNRWFNDTLPECSPEDQIWGWSIRLTEVTSHDHSKINDKVLRSMLNLSLLDNREGAPAWTEVMSVKQAMHLSTNMVVRVLQRIFKRDDKVGHPECLCLIVADSVTVRSKAWSSCICRF